MDNYETPTINSVETDNPETHAIPSVVIAVAAVGVYVVVGTVGAGVVVGHAYIGLHAKP